MLREKADVEEEYSAEVGAVPSVSVFGDKLLCGGRGKIFPRRESDEKKF
jgi:hypothetical protein